jgi:hypothetical protein
MLSINTKRLALPLAVTVACFAVPAASLALPHGHSLHRASQARAACNPKRPWVPQDSIAIGERIGRTASQVNAGLDQVKRLSALAHPVYPGSVAAAEAFAAAEGISTAQAQTVLTQYLETLCSA